jgi:hypothetical protein
VSSSTTARSDSYHQSPTQGWSTLIFSSSMGSIRLRLLIILFSSLGLYSSKHWSNAHRRPSIKVGRPCSLRIQVQRWDPTANKHASRPNGRWQLKVREECLFNHRHVFGIWIWSLNRLVRLPPIALCQALLYIYQHFLQQYLAFFIVT